MTCIFRRCVSQLDRHVKKKLVYKRNATSRQLIYVLISANFCYSLYNFILKAIRSIRTFYSMYILHQFFILAYAIIAANCLMFRLPANSRRCLKEEIQKGVLVSGDYDLSDAPGQRADLLVTDTKGHILVSRENIDKGKFAFVTDDYDVFEACFTSKLPAGQRGQDRDVILTLKHGVEAKSYDSLAEVGRLKPLEVELQKLEDLSESIVKDFAYMRQRESEMRDTNESTNSRVLYFSIFSMACLLGLATWQVLYLRRFFKAKKLIE